jgi:arylsulfatase
MDGAQVVEEQATLETLTPRYTERAVKFIEESKGAPFFLYFPHTYPHIPLAASPRFRGKSPLGIYGDVVEEIDWSVGEVMNALRRTGADSNTLVMFSSDNGPWFLGSPGRLRGRKGTTYEGGQRVPFIARFPGRIPRGKTNHAVASVMDLLPTIAALCEAPLPDATLDGVNLWPLLSGRQQSLDREALLFFDNLHLQCARLGKWKLHVARYNSAPYQAPPAGGRLNLPLPKPELYDLVADPDESYDVAEENPEVVNDIQQRIDRLLAGLPESVRAARAETLSRKVAATATAAHPRPAQ